MKTTSLYGLIYPDLDPQCRFDDSNLFKEKEQFGVLLKRIKIYFGKNIKANTALLGFEASYANCLTGKNIDVEYRGGKKDGNEVQIKELIMEKNDYINNFEINFEDDITYIRLTSYNGKEIEFGKRPDKVITILNFEGENMIQFFWGDYTDEGIKAIGFKYTPKKVFHFVKIVPILRLRYKLNNDEIFKNKYKDNYKELLKDNNCMLTLFRTCLLPDTCFSKVIKYC